MYIWRLINGFFRIVCRPKARAILTLFARRRRSITESYLSENKSKIKTPIKSVQVQTHHRYIGDRKNIMVRIRLLISGPIESFANYNKTNHLSLQHNRARRPRKPKVATCAPLAAVMAKRNHLTATVFNFTVFCSTDHRSA